MACQGEIWQPLLLAQKYFLLMTDLCQSTPPPAVRYIPAVPRRRGLHYDSADNDARGFNLEEAASVIHYDVPYKHTENGTAH